MCPCVENIHEKTNVSFNVCARVCMCGASFVTLLVAFVRHTNALTHMQCSWDWPESESEQARMMKDIRARMKEAFDKKIVVPTKHLEVVPVKAKEETKQDVESKRKRERPEGTQDDAGEAVPPKEKQQRKTSPQTL